MHQQQKPLGYYRRQFNRLNQINQVLKLCGTFTSASEKLWPRNVVPYRPEQVESPSKGQTDNSCDENHDKGSGSQGPKAWATSPDQQLKIQGAISLMTQICSEVEIWETEDGERRINHYDDRLKDTGEKLQACEESQNESLVGCLVGVLNAVGIRERDLSRGMRRAM